MSDSTGSTSSDDQPQQPGYPPPQPQQQPYGQQEQQSQQSQPFGQPQYDQSQYGQGQYGQSQYDQSQYGQSQYGQGQYGQPAYGQSDRDPHKRPGTVTAAAVITLIMSGLTLVLFVLGMAALGVARDDVVSEMRGQEGLQNIDPNDIVSVLLVVFGAFIIWCIIAMVLAVLAMRRSNGARIGLVVSAALAAALSLLGITSGISAITLLAAIAVIILLFVGGASDWYRAKGGGSTTSGGYGGPVA